MASRRRGFTVKYRVVPCTCGMERISGLICPDCGQRPAAHEVDPQLQRRRKAAMSAIAVLDDDQHAIQPVNVPQGSTPIDAISKLLNDVVDWEQRLWPSLHQAHNSATDLADHVTRLIALQKALRGLPRHRPWLNAFCSIEAIYAGFEALLRYCLAALIASSPIEAQGYQKKIQSELDAAADEARALGDWISNYNRLTDVSEFDQLAPLLAELSIHRAQVANEAEAWHEYETRGVQLYRDITKSTTPAPAGLGSYLLLLESSASVFGSAADFRHVAEAAATIIIAHPNEALLIANQPHWKREMVQRIIEMYDGSRKTNLLISLARYEREVLSALIETGHRLVESSSRPQIATLLSLVQGSSYDDVRSCTSGKVLSLLESAGYVNLTAGIYRPLRHAWAHSAYRDTGSRVELLSDSGAVKASLSYAELIDSLLTGEETVQALTAGIIAAYASLGSDTSSLMPSHEHFPYVPQMKTVGTLFGWRNVEVSHPNETTILIVTQTLHDPPSWGAIFAIAQFVPQGIRLLHVARQHGMPGVEIPLDLARRWAAEADEFERQLAFAVLLRNAKYKDISVCSSDQFRCYIARLAAQALTETSAAACIKGLRRLKSAANAVNDDELESALIAAILVQRTQILGITPNRGEAADVQRLVDYAQLKVTAPSL